MFSQKKNKKIFFTFLNTVLKTNSEIVLETVLELVFFQINKIFFYVYEHCFKNNLEIVLETALNIVFLQKNFFNGFFNF